MRFSAPDRAWRRSKNDRGRAEVRGVEMAVDQAGCRSCRMPSGQLDDRSRRWRAHEPGSQAIVSTSRCSQTLPDTVG